ncbi:MAG: hypothetical protein RLZZ584_4407, partial [Pseudomonadota bacterium]
MSTPSDVRPASLGGCVSATIRRADDGSLRLASTEELRWFPERLTDCLEQTAATAPDRTLIARREGPSGDWRSISYAEMLQRAQAVGQALVDRGLSAERPVVILSDNDLEHFTLALGCLWAGVPYAPVSPAYAVLSQDFAKLRHILGTLTPGLVFAADGQAFSRAISNCVGADVEVVLTQGEVEG